MIRKEYINQPNKHIHSKFKYLKLKTNNLKWILVTVYKRGSSQKKWKRKQLRLCLDIISLQHTNLSAYHPNRSSWTKLPRSGQNILNNVTENIGSSYTRKNCRDIFLFLEIVEGQVYVSHNHMYLEIFSHVTNHTLHSNSAGTSSPVAEIHQEEKTISLPDIIKIMCMELLYDLQ